jgi:hypothetical protein
VKKITGMMVHQCQYCSDVFNTIPQRDQHARVAHKEIIHLQQNWIPCPNCKKYFANEKSAIEHTNNNCKNKKTFHENNGCFVCEYCTTVFNSWNEQRNHVLQCHPEEMSLNSGIEQRNHIEGSP